MISGACLIEHSVFNWIIAWLNIEEFKIFSYVCRLRAAEDELHIVMTELREKQAMLANVEEKIAELQKSYDDSISEKQKLERNIATTGSRLKRAAKLTTALADEQGRWGKSVEVSRLQGDKNFQLFTCFILSSVVNKYYDIYLVMFLKY